MTKLYGVERQRYAALLAQRHTEFLEDLKDLERKENEAVSNSNSKHIPTQLQLEATRLHCNVKRVVGKERLKVTALTQLAQDRNRAISQDEAEELARDIVATLGKYGRSLEGQLADSTMFVGRGRGAKLRVQQFFSEEHNKLVVELNLLVTKAKLEQSRLPQHQSTPSHRMELFVDGIESFSRVSGVPGSSDREDLECLRYISERDIKQALAEIIGETVIPKDWGGEGADLFTTLVRIEGKRVSTAFLLKGPAKFKPMNIPSLGKNGDQVDRLFSEPADLMVLQHCHIVQPSVRKMMRAYASREGSRKQFCIIDGFDTLRILRAYHKCGQ